MFPENAEKLITDFLISKVTPSVIYLFGSQATQQIHNESDFDIAYLSKQKLEHYDRFMLEPELATQLNRDVDLIDLEHASTVFQTQIISKGKTLFCSDEKEKSLFEMRTLKSYAKLNEERQDDVLNGIIERDQVYKNDIIINKVSAIERYIKRIKEEYGNNPLNLENYTKQDSIILNIQHACEACIDVTMHVIAEKKLGIPRTSRDAFEFLSKNKIITDALSFRMKAMVGFRNIAVHDYQEINLDIVKVIIEKHLDDYKEFTKQVLSYDN